MLTVAAGRGEAVVMESAGFTVIEKVLFTEAPVLSVNVIITLLALPPVTVPVMVLPPVMLSPAGRFCADQLYPVLEPPDPASVTVYGPFSVAAGKGVAVVIDSAGSTVRVGLALVVAPLASVTLIVGL